MQIQCADTECRYTAHPSYRDGAVCECTYKALYRVHWQVRVVATKCTAPHMQGVQSKLQMCTHNAQRQLRRLQIQQQQTQNGKGSLLSACAVGCDPYPYPYNVHF